jgi:hypothetical protein
LNRAASSRFTHAANAGIKSTTPFNEINALRDFHPDPATILSPSRKPASE